MVIFKILAGFAAIGIGVGEIESLIIYGLIDGGTIGGDGDGFSGGLGGS